MPRRSKVDSGIYQVDLVAGLFGGFMLIWITSARESPVVAEPTDSLTLATTELSLVFRDSATGTEAAFSIIAPEAKDLACMDLDHASQLGLAPIDRGALCPESISGSNVVNRQDIVHFAHFVEGCDASTAPLRYSANVVGDATVSPDIGTPWAVLARQVWNAGAWPHLELDPDVTDPECPVDHDPSGLLLVHVVPPDLDPWDLGELDIDLKIDEETPFLATVVGSTKTEIGILQAATEAQENPPTGTPFVLAKVCAYRDRRARCFTGEGELISNAVSLTLLPDP